MRKKNGRRGWQKFYECKTFGSVNTFLPTEMRWRREREKKENGEREKRKLYENKMYSKSFISRFKQNLSLSIFFLFTNDSFLYGKFFEKLLQSSDFKLKK